MKILYTAFESELPPKLWGQYLKQLPPSFQIKTSRFLRWQDRHAYLFGKLLLLKGLRAFGFAPTCLESLKFNRYGKPYLDSDIDFNVSHSGNYVLCGISSTRKLGIDIEKIRPVELSNFRSVLSDQEWKQIHETENPLEQFYKYWTIKESVAKAEGKGFSIPPIEIQVSDQNFISLANTTWHLQPLKIVPGYSSWIATSTPIAEAIDFQYVDFYEMPPAP